MKFTAKRKKQVNFNTSIPVIENFSKIMKTISENWYNSSPSVANNK